jgi:hypothetical protein
LRSVYAVGRGSARTREDGAGRSAHEERAEQRLAPGGHRPPDPEQSITQTSVEDRARDVSQPETECALCTASIAVMW